MRQYAAIDAEIARLRATHTLIRPGRPQFNGFVERLQRTILEECWKPAFARYLVRSTWVSSANWSATFRSTTTTGRTTDARQKGQTPVQVLGAAKIWRWQTRCVGTSPNQYRPVSSAPC
ncbi:MAG: transposase [Coriobacteriia bacterium]|nr:transposase [Coriobacteriia bacterium]